MQKPKKQNNLKVTFLGTGTSQGVPVIGCDCEVCSSKDPKDKRLRSSVLISKNDKNILVDIGPDFRQQILSNKIKDLHAIVLTHEHNDHIIGLDDVRPFNFQYRKNMKVFCVERVAKELKTRFSYVFDHNPYPGAPRVELCLINERDPFCVEGLNVIPIEVFHGSLSVLGYRVDDFTYITDAKIFPEPSIKKIKGSKILVLNALHHKAHHSHLNLEQALEFIDFIQPEKAFLLHISHNMGLHEAINNKLPENVFLAHDGLTINL